MNVQELKAMATKWFDAFNAHDLEQLLSLYHDDAVHYSPKLKLRHPETKGQVRGKDALRLWWSDSFKRIPSLQYEVLRLTAEDNRVFMEYIRHADGDEDLYVGEMLELAGAKIKASAVFHR